MDYFNGFISILTLIVAYNALKVWKNQLRGTDKYNLLKKLLKSTYKFEEEVKSVRNPMVSYNQSDVDKSSKIDVEKDIYNKRFNRLVREFLELKTLLMESKLHWGRDNLDTLFNPLQSIVGELRGAIWMYFHIKESDNPKDIEKSVREENHNLIYDVSSKDKLDEFSQKVNDIVKNIEKFIDTEMKKI
ncbi:hypothetical protein [Sulfurimonas sp.]